MERKTFTAWAVKDGDKITFIHLEKGPAEAIALTTMVQGQCTSMAEARGAKIASVQLNWNCQGSRFSTSARHAR